MSRASADARLEVNGRTPLESNTGEINTPTKIALFCEDFSHDPAEIKELIVSILGENLSNRMYGFLKSVMPRKGELSVFIARKSYAVFRVFQKAYPTDFGKYQSTPTDKDVGCVIHDRNVCEWLKVYADEPLTNVKIIDDTLLHGSAVKGCYDLLQAYNSLREMKFNVRVYIFAVNEQLTDETYVSERNESRKADRPLLLVKKIEEGGDTLGGGLNTGLLVADYKFRGKEPYNFDLFYYGEKTREDARHMARKFVELIHAASVPYTTYYPHFLLSFEEAEELLYGKGTDFSISEPFKESVMRHIASVWESSFRSGAVHNVSAFSAVLKHTSDFEHCTMLRFYVNQNLRKVLVIPYICFKSYKLNKRYEIKPDIIDSLLHDAIGCESVEEENHRTRLRMMRYIRALDIVEKVFGGKLCQRKVDKIGFISEWLNSHDVKWGETEKFFTENKEAFNWNVSDEELILISDEKAAQRLRTYKSLALYSYMEPVHKHEYDLFFDKLSDEYHRTGGIAFDTFIKKVIGNMRGPNKFTKRGKRDIACVFTVALCDRGVGIPGVNAKILDEDTVLVGSRIRDGELSVEAFAEIPEMSSLPWVVSEVRKAFTEANMWSAKVKDRLKNSLLHKLSGDKAARELIEMFFTVDDNTMGDYLIHGSDFYVHAENSFPETRLLFEVKAEYFNKLRTGAAAECRVC
jgi:hypothetical protein